MPLYDAKKEASVSVNAHGMTLSVCRRALDADAIINLPVLKAHCQTVITCALKNLKGLIPDSEKRRYHQWGIHRPVAVLNTIVQPAFTLVDGLCGDLTFEEGGNPVPMHRLLLSRDPVLLDSYAAHLLGFSLGDVEMIALAQHLGVGKAFESPAQLVEWNRPEREDTTFTLSKRSSALGKNVKADKACSACYASLIFALNRLQDQGLSPQFPLYIGQAYQGIVREGVGIGRCCQGFSQHVQGCPPSAKAIVDFLLEQTT